MRITIIATGVAVLLSSAAGVYAQGAETAAPDPSAANHEPAPPRAEPESSEAGVKHLINARAHLANGDLEPAVKELDAFLAQHPTHLQALLMRGRANARLGRHEQAQADFGNALVAMTDKSEGVYLERAAELTKAKQPELALSVIEEGIVHVGPVLQLEQAAIELELALGRTDDALARIDFLIKHSSRKEQLFAKKAAILEQAGRPEAARTAREQALMAIDDLPQAQRVGTTKKLRNQLAAALDRPTR
jgi:tetratricopeptide (TPR) repeat protein